MRFVEFTRPDVSVDDAEDVEQTTISVNPEFVESVFDTQHGGGTPSGNSMITMTSGDKFRVSMRAADVVRKLLIPNT